MILMAYLRQGGCLVAALALASYVHAQHSDIAVYRNGDGRVSVHGSSGGQAETNYFLRNFDFWDTGLNVYAGDDPGFQMSGTSPPSGYSALFSNAPLQLDVVPIHIPGMPAGNFIFWDGISSEVEFGTPPTGHVMFLEDAANTEIMLDASRDRFEDLIAGVTNGSGGLHEHLTFVVENGGAEPVVGFYMMGWRLTADGLEDSALATIVLSTPSIPPAVDNAVSAWLQQNADSITMAGDFDNNGEYELADVDALVAAIASGAYDAAFDLNGDEFTDRDDLTLWREIAGSVLNDSGGPVLPGDANLDGIVNGPDFVIWNDNKFTSIAAWSAGDFNADGAVDGQDFVEWNNFKFMEADGALLPVPEPRPIFLVAAALACFGRLRWRGVSR